jgi:hypothetical protein
MTAEKVLAGLLEPGDVICVHHHHDSRCGECLAPWQAQAVITGRPAPVSGRLVVNWAAGIRPAGGRGTVTGVSVFSPDEQVVRIGRPPAARPGALALMPRAGATPTPGHGSWLAPGCRRAAHRRRSGVSLGPDRLSRADADQGDLGAGGRRSTVHQRRLCPGWLFDRVRACARMGMLARRGSGNPRPVAAAGLRYCGVVATSWGAGSPARLDPNVRVAPG